MSGKYSDGKTYKVIAFIFANFFKDEEQRIMKRMVAESRRHNCKVVFFSTLADFYFNDINDKGEQKIFTAVSVERFDAIVLMSESFKLDEEQLAMVARAQAVGVPVITVDKSFEGCINLVMDYGNCFQKIVDHMIQFHGYRQVYFMSGMPNNSFSQEREQVYLDAMQAVGVPEQQCRIYYGYFWEEPCRKAMEQMFQEIEEGLETPEAIICANDSMALEVGAFLKERGYRIPEDIAVSGFDGLEMERYYRPRLTTGIYNVDLLVSTIFQMVDEGCPEAYQKERIPIYNKMRIGQSCGCSGVESQSVSNEMVILKRELHRLLKYQGDLNQMVVNIGTMKPLNEALHVVPEVMGSLWYKDFWFCANEGFLEKDSVAIGLAGHKKDNGEDYTRILKVLHYHSLDEIGVEQGSADVEFWEDMEFGEIIPGLYTQLEDNDFLIVTTVHLQGKSIGYTAITLDTNNFWYVGYSAFLASFRHLMELQRSQKQLMKMYMEDLLTGLYNRNGFYLKVNGLLETAENQDLSIISLDMDGLKQINDTYGHAEGDEALHCLGRIIQDSLQQEFAARIGGDEFLIAFTGRDIYKRTEEIVSHIKQGIREYNEVSTKAYEIHASIGSYTDCVRNHTLDYFLKKADDLMYARKSIHKKRMGLTR
ncbi:MAG: GGDEF domain-containing protein [Acetatifactor sp.]|nr:GGDEF domain-containing protein [Acetatifactor sp.]